MRLYAVRQNDTAFRIDLQDFARTQQRRREQIPLLRIGRQPFQQSVDLLQQRIAAALDRLRIQ